jgi:hypothetical protein
MKRSRVFLIATAALFVAWLGWLLYLVTITDRPQIVLSRPQFLISELDVVAQVDGFNWPILVQDVQNPESARDQKGAKIFVDNLDEHCKGYDGPGVYILPLVNVTKSGEAQTASVALTPPSPGYPAGPPRIYRATPETLSQLRHIPKLSSVVQNPL